MTNKLKVLELYSGIGGMHYALRGSGVLSEVIAAVDINTVANAVYKHNFSTTKLLQRNIQSICVKELNTLQPDMILMSPPCQPFTRVGLKKDVNDERTNSFLYIVSILSQIHSLKYILMENVKGFETSDARNKFIASLDANDFIYQEFLLSPHQFHIPNVRHRYYLLAKHKPQMFPFKRVPQPFTALPITSHDFQTDRSELFKHIESFNSKYFKLCEISSDTPDHQQCFSLRHILENNVNESKFELSEKTLVKHAELLDIVTPLSTKSCCFTKAYGHFIEGTGSVLSTQAKELISQVYEQCRLLELGSEEYMQKFRSLKMRYFTPKEMARLMCFPENEFSFPESVTIKQQYRLLGNSINVHVVSLLLILLTFENPS